jgi:hypothetical protein
MIGTDDIRKNLEKGFYPQNLDVLVQQCMEAARLDEEPLLYYTLASIFDQLSERWATRAPLLASEPEDVQNKLYDKIVALINDFDQNRKSNICQSLNELIKTFLTLGYEYKVS